MFSLCIEKHKLYQQEFANYLFNYASSDSDHNNFKATAKKCWEEQGICNIWRFKSSIKTKRCFVIVPSLFNSPEILFFNKKDSFVGYLKQFGDVYLVEWISVVQSLNLADYSASIARVIEFIRNSTSGDIHLIGHCIGGNIAIFSTFITNNIHSLTLLTTPWDYSHFSTPLFLAEQLDLKKAIAGLKTVPRIYIQILFFMLFPKNYHTKLIKYFDLGTKEAKEKYLRVEKWLQSGIDISSSLYEEILDCLIAKNSLVNNNFYVKDTKISLEHIKLPTCIVSARGDQIAPVASIAPLKQGLQNSTFISVKGGHISYLVNNDKQFKVEYAGWLNRLYSNSH